MSKHIAQWLQSSVGVRDSEIKQIYNGVSTTRFNPNGTLPINLPWPTSGSDRPIVIGTVGRLDPVKNQARLLKAFADAVQRVPQGRQRLRLALVGDGALKEPLRAQATALGIAELVWMPGARNDIAECLRAIDIFVLPSLNEGISNTRLEAMATARPVVAAAVGGNSELVVDDLTGSLYSNAVVNALSDSIVRYAQDAESRTSHGRAGRQRVEREFSLQSMINNYLSLYDEQLAN
jgi:sugar transferase (PEP-CTERM/EpsH1 system associated)